LRLLLVDDSVSVRKVVGKMLSRAGYEVATANDGQDALELLRQTSFDVILTDLEMPRLNGYELIEDIRRRHSRERLPVVVMTTRAGEKHMNLALELGANSYLTKPVDETKLLNFLRTLSAKDDSLVTR
jgi:chemosensory pili system protein ChpA (sensor histidine kinase/response regulator)